MESGSAGPVQALTHYPREEAALKAGIERVGAVGTGCYGVDVRAFDALKPPYYHYEWEDEEHTRVASTEDIPFSRDLAMAGVPVFVDWDHWADHSKSKRVAKPGIATMVDVTGRLRENFLAIEAAKQANVEAMQSGQRPTFLEPQPPRGNDIHFEPPKWTPNAVSEETRRYQLESVALSPPPKLEAQREPFGIDEAVAFALSVEGWMTQAELEWLAVTASELGPEDVWIEVGSWKGRSFSAVALAAPQGVHVVAVDEWAGGMNPDGSINRVPAEGERIYQEFRSAYRSVVALRPNQGRFIERSDSIRVARRLLSGFAVVFIDGAHDYASAKADIEAWRDKLKPGGLLCGHDRNDPGVAKALAEVFGVGATVMHGPGSIWFVQINAPAWTPTLLDDQGRARAYFGPPIKTGANGEGE
jgi:hypothetical protein